MIETQRQIKEVIHPLTFRGACITIKQDCSTLNSSSIKQMMPELFLCVSRLPNIKVKTGSRRMYKRRKGGNT